jgi:hypothetical protein
VGIEDRRGADATGSGARTVRTVQLRDHRNEAGFAVWKTRMGWTFDILDVGD